VPLEVHWVPSRVVEENVSRYVEDAGTNANEEGRVLTLPEEDVTTTSPGFEVGFFTVGDRTVTVSIVCERITA